MTRQILYQMLDIVLGFLSILCLCSANDVNPRVFLVNLAQVSVFKEMRVNQKFLITRLSRGDYVIGYQPIHSSADSYWMSIVYPTIGYIFNDFLADELTLLELNSLIKGCPQASHYIQSHQTLMTCGFSLSWLQQWPIGNGLNGALVGGSLAQEVIPLSVADFFVGNREEFEDAHKMRNTYRSSLTNSSCLLKHQEVELAREALKAGRFVEAEQHMDQVKGNSFGRFEYLADMTLLYMLPLSYSSQIIENVPKKADGLTMSLIGRAGNLWVSDLGGRDFVLKQATSLMKLNKLKEKYRLDSASHPSNNIIALSKHVSTLNLIDGIAKSIFLSPIPTVDKFNISTRPIFGFDFHHREWFASEADDVIVGNISCTKYVHNEKQSQVSGCLDLLWRFSRDTDGKNPDLSYSLSTAKIKLNNKLALQHRIGLSIVTNLEQVVSPTFTCMAVHCLGRNSSKMFRVGGESEKYSVFGHCMNAENVLIIMHTEKQDNLQFIDEFIQEKSPKGKSKPNEEYFTRKLKVIEALRKKCWRIVDAAVSKGYNDLLHSHKNLFSSRMNRVKVEVNGVDHPNSPTILVSQNYSDKFPFTDSGLNIRKALGMYDYGRYLMFSSATRHVANLQGIWAEGKKSMWNGDYHMNINMQMMYWPAEVSGLDETISPLVQYIRKLTRQGRVTAKHVYNCRGWVSHAYVDGFMDGGITGGLQWNLCVTCGAWVALKLWEILEFKMDSWVLTDNLLPVFGGIALFFLDYLLPMPGKSEMLFTGPTTSPETSFANGKSVHFLTFNPAIDMSILRQVSNAYSLAIEILQSNVNHNVSISLIEKHTILAKRFREAVLKLPFHAQPVIGTTKNFILEYPLPYPNALTTLSTFEEYVNDLRNKSEAGILFINVSLDSFRPVNSKDIEKIRLKLIHEKHDGTEFTENRVKDAYDLAHRHYSHLQWFYPGPFTPYTTDLNRAVHSTLTEKGAMGSAHTAWSAAWLACLWARLGPADTENAWMEVEKILSKYTFYRLQSSHPVLGKENEECITCYKELPSFQQEGMKQGFYQRALTSSDNSAFQLDGNIGILSAINEMLLQSHVSGHVYILPSLPTLLQRAGGRFLNLRARGNLEISAAWTGQSKDSDNNKFVGNRLLTSESGQVYALKIKASSYHPWYGFSQANETTPPNVGLIESSPGFFQLRKQNKLSCNVTNQSTEEIIVVTLPFSKSKLQLLSYEKLANRKSSKNPKYVKEEYKSSWFYKKRSTSFKPIEIIEEPKQSNCAKILTFDKHSSYWDEMQVHIKNKRILRPENRRLSQTDFDSKVSNDKENIKGTFKNLFKIKKKVTQKQNRYMFSPIKTSEVIVKVSSYPCEMLFCWDFPISWEIGNSSEYMHKNSFDFCNELLS